MSNHYFQFKQFLIAQDRCAMKVTTDASILGAWVPILPGVKTILDIGAGTGLLAHMVAQKNENVLVDAIEMDEAAALQAKENAAANKWRERINIIQGDVRTYTVEDKYDMIITNPPFFNNSLLGDTDNKNLARHTLSLSYTELLAAIDNNLKNDGYFAILLPLPESKIWEGLAEENGWATFCKLNVMHRHNAPVKRVVLLMKKGIAQHFEAKNLVIQENDGSYTSQFTALLQPFYLKL